MPDLTAFLLARISEDETTAQTVKSAWADGWYGTDPEGSPPEWRLFDRFNPARVLAECEAKRRIVERLAQYLKSSQEYEPEGLWELLDNHVWATLYDLASVYADHPDYDPSWRAE